jgi:hypothetical protein
LNALIITLALLGQVAEPPTLFLSSPRGVVCVPEEGVEAE